jgi:branched-chain amino acid transport system ATP-binding protein
VLEVHELTKKFGGFTAVNRISFEVKRGEIVGLIGPNGSGKSTTFNLLAGMFEPTSGHVMFDGQPMLGLSSSNICKSGVARTFQIPRPFRKLSILENTTLAAFYGASEAITRGEAERRAHDALTLIDLPRDPAVRVDGLGAAGLKKLEMARALATQPKLLLADESLGGLDEIRNGPSRTNAQTHSRRARHHHHLGGTHHGCADESH